MKCTIRFLFSLTLLVLLFSSCLTASSTLVFQPGLGGRLSLDYRISKLASTIQKDSLSGGRLLSLPLSEEEFRERALAIEGLSLQSVSGREDLDFVYIESEIVFDSVRDLSEFMGVPVVLEQVGGLNRLTIFLFDLEEVPQQETQDLLSNLFGEDRLQFSLTVPGGIISSGYGDISDNRQTVDYSVGIEELYQNSAFEWVLEWQ